MRKTLFSYFSKKLRLLVIPHKTKINWTGKKLVYPFGTILVKTFYYDQDQIDFEEGISGPWGENKFLIETRILFKSNRGWLASTYKWDLTKKEAFKITSRELLPLKLKQNTNLIDFDFVIPSSGQCLSCHNSGVGGIAKVLGPERADNLLINNQLQNWIKKGLLEDSSNRTNLKPLPIWNDENEKLTNKAHAYFQVNCSHCHNPNGVARMTQLFLQYENPLYQENKLSKSRGFCKPAYLTGKHENIITPGNADNSELHFRLSSRTFGRMPALGRDLKHNEGIDLIENYINSFNQKCD